MTSTRWRRSISIHLGRLRCHYKLPNLIICAQLIEKCEFKCSGAINFATYRSQCIRDISKNSAEKKFSVVLLYYCIIGNKDWKLFTVQSEEKETSLLPRRHTSSQWNFSLSHSLLPLVYSWDCCSFYKKKCKHSPSPWVFRITFVVSTLSLLLMTQEKLIQNFLGTTRNEEINNELHPSRIDVVDNVRTLLVLLFSHFLYQNNKFHWSFYIDIIIGIGASSSSILRLNFFYFLIFFLYLIWFTSQLRARVV